MRFSAGSIISVELWIFCEKQIPRLPTPARLLGVMCILFVFTGGVVPDGFAERSISPYNTVLSPPV